MMIREWMHTKKQRKVEEYDYDEGLGPAVIPHQENAFRKQLPARSESHGKMTVQWRRSGKFSEQY